jgi:hypothetical protein
VAYRKDAVEEFLVEFIGIITNPFVDETTSSDDNDDVSSTTLIVAEFEGLS